MFKRLDQVDRGDSLVIYVDGDPVTAYPGETIAAALLTAGKDVMRKTLLSGNPRGYYCGMGVCCECMVELEDGVKVKACQTLVAQGMKVKTYPENRQEE